MLYSVYLINHSAYYELFAQLYFAIYLLILVFKYSKSQVQDALSCTCDNNIIVKLQLFFFTIFGEVYQGW